MNGETRTADAVKTEKDPALLAQLKEMREVMELHDLYKKHQATLKQIKDDDGDMVEDESDMTYVDYNTKLCHGCHMPIDEHDTITSHSLDTFLGSEKKANHPATTIIAMEMRLRDFVKKKSTRSEDNHLVVDTEAVKYKAYFDHTKMKKQLLSGLRNFNLGLDQYGEPKDQEDEISGAYKNLVRYDENILGKYTPETKAALEEFMQKAPTRDSWRVKNKMGEVSELYAALALRHKWNLGKKDMTLLMRKCKNFRMKQAITLQLGQFRVSAMRGTELNDCLPSYYYCRNNKPELLQDPVWVSKKFRFDKHENRVVALRYFIDTGLGIKHLQEDDHLMCAVARFIPDKYPDAAATIKKWVAEQLKREEPDGYQFVFGSQADRRALYTVDDEFQLIHQCTHIEQFFHHMLPEELQKQTDNPVNDVLAPAVAGDHY
jgi:hypothetical protein